MKVIFNSMKGTSRISAKMNLQQKNVPDKFEAAVREILKLFQKTNEIGRLEKPIVVSIANPLKDSKISEAKLKIESPKFKQDFRSRVLSMIAESEELRGGTSVVIACGNKYAIESTLQNKNFVKEFKKFVLEAEKDFVA